MEDICKKILLEQSPLLVGHVSQANSSLVAACQQETRAELARVLFGTLGVGEFVSSDVSQDGIELDITPGHTLLQLGPRFDIPGPMMKTMRDPALSLVGLSGMDPEGPVMVQTPPVHNDNASNISLALVGWRIGFADEYLRGGVREFVEHSAHFSQVLDVLRRAGVLLVPVTARLADEALYFTLEHNNEIDDRVTEHGLDALVCDGLSAAFHRSAELGCPGICLEGSADNDGVVPSVWFYGARWGRSRVEALVKGYQQALRAMGQSETLFASRMRG